MIADSLPDFKGRSDGKPLIARAVLMNLRIWRVPYNPRPDERAFLQRAVVQRDDELTIEVAVLDDREGARFFGVPLARRGIQPVWLRIANNGKQPSRLRLRQP